MTADIGTNKFTKQIERERRRDWDQWISRLGENSALLDLGTRTTVERTNPKFYQRKTKKVWNEVYLRVSTAIEEKVVEGQRMFVVCFSRQDQERDPEA